ncbi:phosphoribosyltransferase family protein [Kocuria rosea]|uniref:phosphoribosyltransferase family protein n=1 Tax=Kocuria rosea TaxID=1275 RepID=UPI000F720A85|nr:phosphoribosyltransferase family protein [Kocuria rosea]MEB2527269.1 phosphoribosyltransferase family protein [Kocuria rosea]MEB2617338.1 phosphoribosyltransferase family protein [Kocuria rosea]VEH41632.1 Uncharacterised protein [Kocuria rosea]
MIERLSLGRLTTGHPLLTIVPDQGPAPAITDYSRFKHGDGALSAVYGNMLAEAFVPRALESGTSHLAVTSSAFGFAPPAAHSLLAPFVSRARQIAGRRITFVPFQVVRSAISDGDYALMGSAERVSALSRQPLSVEPSADLAGVPVVVLDDVRVTGAHEAWIESAIVRAGAREVSHLYLVDAYDLRREPDVESVLNRSGVLNLTDLVRLSHQRMFIPNARVCKWVVSASPQEQEDFVACAPIWVTDWILRAALLDNLASYPAYRAGTARMESMVEVLQVPA